ncbi:metallophosphoesterase family protein [Catellatospora sp. KI3]|uniref:metallophosphoesterase family protein n=1 Tax=Catellatospora sp. KI3 TaxID=3041620 RepID=UPI0024827615|nr:metallophosphoesterase family protein [Catellatospora sp. KI3]MDI1462745.1 metallophosphoesterase family protein [Catellatospora sp. KI3]
MTTPRLGPVRRVAVLADVHGNVPALLAVLDDVHAAGADLIVFPGDLTWGPEPQTTLDLILELGSKAVCVRGNADRAVVELARGEREHTRPRDPWMPAQHTPEAVEFLAALPLNVVIDIEGLGAVRFCHGSPRDDTECVTPQTSTERFAELSEGVDEQVIVTGHTHLQFDRLIAGRRSVNPGSVGLPYHLGMPGTAYWALLGPDVRLRETRYDVQEAVDRCRMTGDPSGDAIVGLLLNPPTPDEIIADAETRVFAD